MLTYIKLKNFMSIKEAVFDFRDKNKAIKNFITIYGSNGSGKSNFVKSIEMLLKSLDSLDNINMVSVGKQKNNNSIKFTDSIANILDDIKNCRMLDCEEEASVEYGFEFNYHS